MILFVLICFFIKLTSLPTDRTHPLTRALPSRLKDHPEVIKALRNFQEMIQLALAVDLAIWGGCSSSFCSCKFGDSILRVQFTSGSED